MPLPAVLVTVTAAERTALKKRIRGTRTAWRDRLRAQIVPAAAMGRSNARIARDLSISQDTVRKWRGRFADRGLEGLSDLPRPGRPRQISAEVRAAVVALACQLPAVTGVPLAHWTGPELAAERRPGAGQLHLGIIGPADPGRHHQRPVRIEHGQLCLGEGHQGDRDLAGAGDGDL